ncbi:hypothetical protein ACOKW7_16415 [Limnospira platensis CENA597]|uniref:hypothetical protein n=1 Tax=Limnospira platensis TaxID=118562 RepID=UPI003D6F5064
MDSNVLPDIVKLGTDGITVFLVWQLMKQNQKLISEVNSRDNELMKLIYTILNQYRQYPTGLSDRTGPINHPREKAKE